MISKENISKKKIFRIGSCRIFNIPQFFLSNISFCNHPLGYTHTTCETIQLIKMLRGEKKIPQRLYPFIFSFFSGKDAYEDFNQIFQENVNALANSDTVLIEISSRKKVSFEGTYLQYVLFKQPHLQGIDPMDPEMVESLEIKKQTPLEIMADLNEISVLLQGKKLIFTSHINASVSDEPVVPERQILDDCLSRFAEKHKHNYYSAWRALANGDPKYVCEDLTHLTPLGAILIRKRISQFALGSTLANRLVSCAEQAVGVGNLMYRQIRSRFAKKLLNRCAHASHAPQGC